MDKNYEELYGKFTDYQKELHELNQKKIEIGLKVNVLLPLVFLIISFMTSGSKLIFLILWIASLFGIAFYLIYIEYSDYKLQEKMHEFGMKKETEEESLIGDVVVIAEQQVNEQLDEVDVIVEREKERIKSEIKARQKQLKELKKRGKQ